MENIRNLVLIIQRFQSLNKVGAKTLQLKNNQDISQEFNKVLMHSNNEIVINKKEREINNPILNRLADVNPVYSNNYYSDEKYQSGHFEDIREHESIKIAIPCVRRLQANRYIDEDYQYIDNEYSQQLKNDF